MVVRLFATKLYRKKHVLHYWMIILFNCISSVGISAIIRIVPIWPWLSLATMKSFSRAGIVSTAINRRLPRAKAPRLQGLLARPSFVRGFLLLQLKPWKSLARVNVAKAMVLAVAAFVLRPR